MITPSNIPATGRRSFSARLMLTAQALAIALAIVVPATTASRSANAADIQLVDDGNRYASTVLIDGNIEKGDADRFERLVKSLPADRPVSVRLNSGGGYTLEAIKMGRFFHRSMIRAYVVGAGSKCIGVCALAFLGGRDTINGKAFRVKGSEAKLAFHGFQANVADKEFTVADMKVATAETQNVIMRITEYMVEIGADMEFMIATLTVPGSAEIVMSNQNAHRLGIHIMDDRSGRLALSRPGVQQVAQAN
jgi:hypothetical protein